MVSPRINARTPIYVQQRLNLHCVTIRLNQSVAMSPMPSLAAIILVFAADVIAELVVNLSNTKTPIPTIHGVRSIK